VSFFVYREKCEIAKPLPERIAIHFTFGLPDFSDFPSFGLILLILRHASNFEQRAANARLPHP